MNAWIRFWIYLVYRSIRLVVHTLQTGLIWRFNGVQSHLENLCSNPASVKEDCQILTIIARSKFFIAEVGSPWDFIWRHEKFVCAKEILAPDPCWSLYALDEEYAYFIRLPKPWPCYHAREAPFVFQSQFCSGTKLARMPLRAFLRFTEESLPEPRGPVVCLSCCARSGSTLLMKVMQVSEKHIICFHEPNGVTSLGILFRRGLLDENTTTNLLKAVLKYDCKTQEPGQTYLIKTPTSGPILVPMIKKAMPQIKHLFLFRRNTALCLRSMEKLLKKSYTVDVSVTVRKYCPWLSSKMFPSDYYAEIRRRFGEKDCLDKATLGYVSAWSYYHQNRHLLDTPIVYYEDLLAEKEETLRAIFQLCELPYRQFIGNALEEFSKDSQAGTTHSQDKMKGVEYSPLDDERIKRIHYICDELGAPRLAVD